MWISSLKPIICSIHISFEHSAGFGYAHLITISYTSGWNSALCRNGHMNVNVAFGYVNATIPSLNLAGSINEFFSNCSNGVCLKSLSTKLCRVDENACLQDGREFQCFDLAESIILNHAIFDKPNDIDTFHSCLLSCKCLKVLYGQDHCVESKACQCPLIYKCWVHTSIPIFNFSKFRSSWQMSTSQFPQIDCPWKVVIEHLNWKS